MSSATLYSHTSTVLLTRGRGSTLVGAARVRLRDRWAAQWRARRLDRALADGVAPETSVPLALRAQTLTEADRRWSMAGSLRRVVSEAEERRLPRLGWVVPNRVAVQAASTELRVLADVLDDPGPVAAHGVAQAWLLLTDGTGPLYNPSSDEPLSAQAARAASDLRPWSA